MAQRAGRLLGEEGSLLTEILVGVSSPASPEEPQEPRPPSAEELAAAGELVRARDRGVALTGPDGAAQGVDEDGRGDWLG